MTAVTVVTVFYEHFLDACVCYPLRSVVRAGEELKVEGSQGVFIGEVAFSRQEEGLRVSFT